jgi:chloramphenicol-sensitive protein RarD
VTFSLYGLVKKKAPLGAFEGLTLENGLLLLPAMVWLGVSAADGTGVFLRVGAKTDLLLLGAGIVTTATPGHVRSAAQRIPLSMIGILQYIPRHSVFARSLPVRRSFYQHATHRFRRVWTSVALFLTERWWAARHK